MVVANTINAMTGTKSFINNTENISNNITSGYVQHYYYNTFLIYILQFPHINIVASHRISWKYALARQ